MGWVRGGVIVAIAMALGCGQVAAQEPALDPVAHVGEEAISLADFEHWIALATHTEFGRPVDLVPPQYEDCMTVPLPRQVTKRWRWLGEQGRRDRCARRHAALRRMTMQFLIQARWVEQEAARRGVAVSPRRVERTFERQRRLAFPDPAGYRRYLRETGADEPGIKYRIRLDLLQDRITRQVKRGPAGLQRFIKSFRKRYSSITWCADGYVIDECRAPAPPG